MVDIESIFRYKVPDKSKLAKNGFIYSDGAYTKDAAVMGGQFILHMIAADKGTIKFKLYEAETGEEYVLVHVPGAEGVFVNEVRDACKNVLADIAEKCFDTEVFRSAQTKRILNFIQGHYNISPEFLWEKSPDCAVFRRKENKKWFAVIMTVGKDKLGLPGHGNMEIVNLKDIPENVEKRIGQKRYLKAYHMNKKHWYTVCLDGEIPDTEIVSLVKTSYESVAGKKA